MCFFICIIMHVYVVNVLSGASSRRTICDPNNNPTSTPDFLAFKANLLSLFVLSMLFFSLTSF